VIEVTWTQEAAVKISGRAAKVALELDRGEATDWTAVAEGFETIRDLAAKAAADAWTVYGEDYRLMLDRVAES
jgi:hypothetical protein